MDVFLRHKKYCEYWLLRSKTVYHQSFNTEIPNFIKCLAAVIFYLESDSVTGKKNQKIKELFGYRSPIHRVYKTKDGVRRTQNSQTLENTYFELRILSFLVERGFSIELIKARKKGKKIPEFIAIKKGTRIAVEAKNLHLDSILDNIFGDRFVDGMDYKRSQADKDKGLEKIIYQIQINYENAMEKYNHIDPAEQYIIFMSIHSYYRYIGTPVINYLESVQKSWNDQEYENFLGLVIPEEKQTIFIKHINGSSAAFNLLEEVGINDFHRYVPTIG